MGQTELEVREASARSAKLKYRPYLDGLRCIAVYLVVAFHAGLGRFRGGFIGVDIFFVLSGYLVTRILLSDLVAVGHVRMRTFYARRARRILPASIVTLLVTAVAYKIVQTPAQVLRALDGFRAAFVYVANWYFVHQSGDYFASDVATSPVLQFWSLAVEEQFYLFWPLLLGALFLVTRRLGRSQWWVLRIVVIALGAASAIAALHLASIDVDRAYYGTDTRAYQLLAGAAIALTPQLMRLGPGLRRVARWAIPASLAALLLLASSAIELSPITRGIWVAACTVVLLIALENVREGPVQRALSWGPITYLGRISYGTYLWHWPLLVVLAYGSNRTPFETLLIIGPGATALAALSFAFLERPIRLSSVLDHHKVAVISTGLAASLLLGLVFGPMLLESGASTLDRRLARLDFYRPPTCLARPLAPCVLVHGTGPHVLVMGDSHAQMWLPPLMKIAERENWQLMVATNVSCTWQVGIQQLRQSKYVRVCRLQHQDWFARVVPRFKPDIIVLAERAVDDPLSPDAFYDKDGKSLLPGDPGLQHTLALATSRTLAMMRAPGRRIVILEPIPLSDKQEPPVPCLSGGGPVERCAFQAGPKPTELESYIRGVARDDPDIVSLDVDRLVCPRLPTCDAVVNNIIVKTDRSHLTGTFARSLTGPLERLLREAGIVNRN